MSFPRKRESRPPPSLFIKKIWIPACAGMTTKKEKIEEKVEEREQLHRIEGFWSYAKYILYNYRGVSKYHFPMYLKEVEYRFNHRNENLFKLFFIDLFWLRF